jgi:hypothetical protein
VCLRRQLLRYSETFEHISLDAKALAMNLRLRLGVAQTKPRSATA